MVKNLNKSEIQKRLWQNKEYRKHMSEVHKGKINPNKGRKGWKSNTGRTHFKKGNIPWNNGLKYNCDPKLMEIINKMVKVRKEEGTYNLSKEHKDKISNKLKGVPKLPEHIKKVAQANIGKKRTLKTRNKLKKSRAKQILPFKDSSIEIKIQDFLMTLQIEFLTHKYMNIKNSYQCDIFIPVQIGIPQKIVIECDGDFIHCNPDMYKENYERFPNSKKKKPAKEIWKIDEARTKQLIEKGFRVIRLWEHEIKVMELNDFKNKLK